MSLAFVAATSAIAGHDDHPTIAKPGGLAQGDLMVMAASHQVSDELAIPPAGWTLIRGQPVDVVTLTTFWKIVTPGEAVSYLVNQAHAVVISAYRGPVLSPLVDQASTATSHTNSTATATSVTPTKLGVLVAVFGFGLNAWRPTNAISAWPTGMTGRVQANNVGGDTPAHPASIHLADAPITDLTATGDKTATLNNTQAIRGQAQLIALASVAPPGLVMLA